MWYAICHAIYILSVYFQGEWFPEVEVAKPKPKEVIAASQVMQDVKEERLQTPHRVTTVTCQHKGTTLVISV